MSIVLHIERLVLDGALAASRNPEQIGAVLRVELERSLAVHGLALELVAGGAWASLPGGQIGFVPGAGTQEVGTRVGQAIQAALLSSGERPGVAGPPNG